MYEESENNLWLMENMYFQCILMRYPWEEAGKESLKLVMLLKENYGIYQCRD